MYQFNDNHCDNKYNIYSEKFSKITAARLYYSYEENDCK